MLLASVASNYALLKRFYVLRCAEGGYVMTKETCDKFAQKNMEIVEEHRQEMIANNADLFSDNN
jgi:hypothetical protein